MQSLKNSVSYILFLRKLLEDVLHENEGEHQKRETYGIQVVRPQTWEKSKGNSQGGGD